jgi:phosphatidylglycerol:prolipoprotein diacylglycerol transferase
VAGPLIPYITLPELPLLGKHTLQVLGQAFDIGPLTIKPFGTLVALGVYLGAMLSMRYARRWGLHIEAFSRFMFWVVVWGFVAGHVLDEIFYHPQQVMRDPLSLLKIWAGLSSFGGFAGAVMGVYAFKYRFGIKRIMPFVDVMGAAFPLGWVLGRTGCSVVHDHPGMPSQLWFAVKYPDGSGGRFDLGLYEMWFAVLLMIAALWLARRPKPPGFFVGFTMLVYAPVRFALDFLRARPTDAAVAEADPRYLMLTPAQWASFAMAAGAFYILYKACESNDAGDDAYRNALEGVDPAVFARKQPPPQAA